MLSCPSRPLALPQRFCHCGCSTSLSRITPLKGLYLSTATHSEVRLYFTLCIPLISDRSDDLNDCDGYHKSDSDSADDDDDDDDDDDERLASFHIILW